MTLKLTLLSISRGSLDGLGPNQVWQCIVKEDPHLAVSLTWPRGSAPRLADGEAGMLLISVEPPPSAGLRPQPWWSPRLTSRSLAVGEAGPGLDALG